MPEPKKKPPEFTVDDKGYLMIKKPKPEPPKGNDAWFAVLVGLVVLGMIAVANLPPRNATAPIPQQTNNTNGFN